MPTDPNSSLNHPFRTVTLGAAVSRSTPEALRLFQVFGSSILVVVGIASVSTVCPDALALMNSMPSAVDIRTPTACTKQALVSAVIVSLFEVGSTDSVIFFGPLILLLFWVAEGVFNVR